MMDNQRRVVVLASPKGGVGKTTMGVLLIEWCVHKNISVDFRDTDPGQDLSSWAKYCSERGSFSLSSHSSFIIVDTAGASGSCMSWMKKATYVLCPFRPNFADLSRTATWFSSLEPGLQEKFLFVPNAIGSALEHKNGVLKLSSFVESEVKKGFVLKNCSFRNRDAAYAGLLKGIPINFFELGFKYKAAQMEASKMTREVLKRLNSVKSFS